MTLNTLKGWFRDSLTILWARLVAGFGLIMGFLLVLEPIFNSYEVREMLNGILDPRVVVILFVVIGVVTEIARRRTLPTYGEDDPQ